MLSACSPLFVGQASLKTILKSALSVPSGKHRVLGQTFLGEDPIAGVPN